MFRQFIFVMYFIRLANDSERRRPDARNAGHESPKCGNQPMNEKATARAVAFCGRDRLPDNRAAQA